MDIKTKIQIIVSLSLVTLIGLLTYWVQLPTDDLKAQLLTEDQTILVRIQDFEYIPDVVRVEKGTVVTWLNDETKDNEAVQHSVKAGDLFESDLLSQGDTFSYKFEEDGVFNYNSSLQAFMLGKVCVGAASEDADPECVIDATEPEETLGGDTGTLDDTAGLPTEDVGEATTDDTILPTEDVGEATTDDTTVPPTTDLNEDLADLSGAADENFEPATAATTTTSTTPSEQTPQSNLSKSGPEDYIYIFLALIAVLAAKAVTKKQPE